MDNKLENKPCNPTDESNPLEMNPEGKLYNEDPTKTKVHVLKKGVICRTDYRAKKRSREAIILDATDGFIPLWDKNLVMRWRFNTTSLNIFRQPQAAASYIRQLLRNAITAWGDAAPIRFIENPDNSDFEIVMERFPDCTPEGCTLAQAFFPDAGRHQLFIFPTMFQQSREEQVETLAHEIGHVFGLRHFFAPELETRWPSVIFGENNPFSIMNYGNLSQLTNADQRDLKLLYESVWNGQLTEINGTPIKLFRPYHYGS